LPEDVINHALSFYNPYKTYFTNKVIKYIGLKHYFKDIVLHSLYIDTRYINYICKYCYTISNVLVNEEPHYIDYAFNPSPAQPALINGKLEGSYWVFSSCFIDLENHERNYYENGEIVKFNNSLYKFFKFKFEGVRNVLGIVDFDFHMIYKYYFVKESVQLRYERIRRGEKISY
jgi:hypothetical protein